MFAHLRGRYRLLMVGLALLALAAMVVAAPFSPGGSAIDVILPGPMAFGMAAAVALFGLACILIWWRRQRSDRYDLRRLFEEEPPLPDEREEPYEDTVPKDAIGAPYCGWCDEAYPPDTYRCTRCGRVLT